uniref:Cleavage/polyadenylation specificity factor A subunit C-terminal domain-containing protein n=1 Tax=Ditylenchus dipsaci TaxID=166011 RepID=A0A915DN08_9BILA
MGQRIIVSDSQESVHFMRYKKLENQLIVFCDETTPRYIWQCRYFAFAKECGRRSAGRSMHFWDRGNLNATQKLEQVCQFYVGDMITSIQKTSLVPDSDDGLIYTTISGAIGMLVPFLSRDEFEFFQTLEMHMRVEFPPLCGRDHLAYRSFYAPVKNVIDGDLCEQFTMLDPNKQGEITKNLDLNLPTVVVKKLEDLRTRYAF